MLPVPALLSKNMNKELNLSLTVDEINAILAAIQELPAKFANPLTEKIKGQAVQQLNPQDTEDKKA